MGTRWAPRTASVPGSPALLMPGSAHDRVTLELLQEPHLRQTAGIQPGWSPGPRMVIRRYQLHAGRCCRFPKPCLGGLPTPRMHQLCTLQSAKCRWEGLPGRRRKETPDTESTEPQGPLRSGHGSNAGRAFIAGDAHAKRSGQRAARAGAPGREGAAKTGTKGGRAEAGRATAGPRRHGPWGSRCHLVGKGASLGSEPGLHLRTLGDQAGQGRIQARG